MGKSKNMIEENKAERRKAEICLIKLRYNNEIRNGDAFNELIFLPDDI
jgi:hypothetical protein